MPAGHQRRRFVEYHLSYSTEVPRRRRLVSSILLTALYEDLQGNFKAKDLSGYKLSIKGDQADKRLGLG
jgi:hypothetical protein